MTWMLKNIGLCALAFAIFIAGNKVAASLYHSSKNISHAMEESTNAVALATNCSVVQAKEAVPQHVQMVMAESLAEGRRAMLAKAKVRP